MYLPCRHVQAEFFIFDRSPQTAPADDQHHLKSYRCIFAKRAEMTSMHIKHHSKWRPSCGEGLGTLLASHRLLQSGEATSRAVLVLQLQPNISWTSCTCRGKTNHFQRKISLPFTAAQKNVSDALKSQN